MTIVEFIDPLAIIFRDEAGEIRYNTPRIAEILALPLDVVLRSIDRALAERGASEANRIANRRAHQ